MKRGRTAPKSPRATKKPRTQPNFVSQARISKAIIAERKYFDADVAANFVAIGANWAGAELDPAANSLFNPSTGDDFNNRDGRKVQVLSIKIRGHITVPAQANQTAADAGSLIRLLLVQDTQTNSAQLNAEDVLSSGAGSNQINSFQNPAFFGRFKVLKDKVTFLSNPTISWDGTNVEQSGLVKPFKIFHKFPKPVIVHYNGTNGGTVADVIDNSFHIIGGTDSTALAPGLIYKVRTTFIDV